MAATTLGLVHAGVTDVRTASIAIAALPVLWFWGSRAAVPVVVLVGGLMGLILLQD